MKTYICYYWKIQYDKDVNVIPLKFPARVPIDIDKRILKSSKETVIAKILFLKKEQS